MQWIENCYKCDRYQFKQDISSTKTNGLNASVQDRDCQSGWRKQKQEPTVWCLREIDFKYKTQIG